LVEGISALHQPERVRGVLGYMPDFPPIYENLKVWEFCDLFAQAYGLRGEDRQAKVLQSLYASGLKEQMHTLCKTLSRGMRQRVLLAKTLVHDPSVLLLDEPAANLDPKSRIDLRNVLKKLASDGKTILISSHILSEIEDTCDSLGFMRDGGMALSGTLDEISRQKDRATHLKIHLLEPYPALREVISKIPSLSQFEETAACKTKFRVSLDGGEKEATQALAKLVKTGVPVSEFICQKPRVEELFLELESASKERGKS
jgi:ABC-2 type transport system ATP-binding protein